MAASVAAAVLLENIGTADTLLQTNIAMEYPPFSNRKYIYKSWNFHCYVSLPECISSSSWWLNQPFSFHCATAVGPSRLASTFSTVEPTHLKNMRSRQIGSWNPRDRGENKKHFSCYHPVFIPHLTAASGFALWSQIFFRRDQSITKPKQCIFEGQVPPN